MIIDISFMVYALYKTISLNIKYNLLQCRGYEVLSIHPFDYEITLTSIRIQYCWAKGDEKFFKQGLY